MTGECQEWIKRTVIAYPQMCGDVLEVGSYDVNGNPRAHFADRGRFPTYTGIDMRAGAGVDQVMNTQDMQFSNRSFDVIVDAERMEHDDKFWLSLEEFWRVLKPGGYIIITTRSWNAFPPHDFPSDYWRFMAEGLRTVLESADFECLEVQYGENNQAVFAVARKPAA